MATCGVNVRGGFTLRTCRVLGVRVVCRVWGVGVVTWLLCLSQTHVQSEKRLRHLVEQRDQQLAQLRKVCCSWRSGHKEPGVNNVQHCTGSLSVCGDWCTSCGRLSKPFVNPRIRAQWQWRMLPRLPVCGATMKNLSNVWTYDTPPPPPPNTHTVVPPSCRSRASVMRGMLCVGGRL